MDRLLFKDREELGDQVPCSKPRRNRLRRAIIALSLANVCFINVWKNRFYQPSFFSPSWSWLDWLTLFFNVLVLGAIVYILLALAAKVKVGSRSWEGVVYSIPLFEIADVAWRIVLPGRARIAAVFLVVVPLAAGITIVRWQRKLLPAVEFIVLGLAILFPVNLFRMALVAARHNRPSALAGRFAVSPRPVQRVVWMVFDEMDFALSFPRRPAGMQVPEFDRLRAQSFFATAAHQPGPETEEAMPSIVSGREIYGVPEPQGSRTLRVQFSPAGPLQDWGATPNVFVDARAAHVNVGVVGWYLPYCRVFAAVITDCYWEPLDSGVTDTPALSRSFTDELNALTPVEPRLRHIQRLQRMIVAAKSMADDSQLGFVLIHLPVPHEPEIFDRYTNRVTPYAVHKDWFFDNLLIADRTLGVIRDSMEQAGLWDTSAIIVTSDHSLRESMMAHPHPVPLVPFMVKMPRQSRGMVFNDPFTTTIIRPLISAMLRGEVRATTLPDWMRQHAR